MHVRKEEQGARYGSGRCQYDGHRKTANACNREIAQSEELQEQASAT